MTAASRPEKAPRGMLKHFGAFGLAALFVTIVCVLAGCAGPGFVEEEATSTWAAELTETEQAAFRAELPPKAVAELVPLSEVFYERIASRRFNSRATFEDPSIRQFFPSVAAYSDYYAALVDALDQANLRYNRATQVELLGIDVSENGNLLLELKFIGRNDLPLRWWSATLLRTDEWTWQEGRWFVVPGKV